MALAWSSDSSMYRWTTHRISRLLPHSSQKMARQPKAASTPPPMMGARIGASPITSISEEKARADS